ncbi:MAG: carboxypeptidase regulatory-like domain-containing protein, partial [Bacteroidetes bacterium]|nr:carboxypeptidase regulatory-like domain-containing protein [Bacteroidota bacterium]
MNYRFILLLGFLFCNIILRAQSLLDKEVTLSKENMKIEDALSELGQKAELTFTYGSKIKVDDNIILLERKGTVRHLLDIIFIEQNIVYIEKHGKILLRLSTNQKTVQTIRGTVFDKALRFPLIGAHVIIVDSDPLLGSVTNTEGRFRIEDVPVGRYSVKINYIGYEDYYLNEYLVSSGKEVVLNAALQEAVHQLSTAVVTPQKEGREPLRSMALVSARTFSTEETQRYAASFYDPARMAQSFPGVALADDDGNEIVIRGNSGRGLQWRIEGIEVPNPNHFRNGDGGSGGGINMISHSVLDNSEFLTGAFPAEYGNALSGILAMQSLGAPAQTQYNINLGLAATSLGVAVPITKKIGLRFSGNRSSTGMMFRINGRYSEFTKHPGGADANFNINYDYSPTGHLKLFAFVAKNEIGVRVDQPSFEGIFNSDDLNQLYNLQWTQLASKNWLFKASLSLNNFRT